MASSSSLLQDVVGGPSAFEPFMRSYLTHFAFKTVDSYQFKDFFCDHFKGNAAISSIDWDAWFYNPGMPPVENSYDTSLATAANDLAVRWHTADVMGIGADPPAGAGPADIQGWGTEQVSCVEVLIVVGMRYWCCPMMVTCAVLPCCYTWLLGLPARVFKVHLLCRLLPF